MLEIEKALGLGRRRRDSRIQYCGCSSGSGVGMPPFGIEALDFSIKRLPCHGVVLGLEKRIIAPAGIALPFHAFQRAWPWRVVVGLGWHVGGTLLAWCLSCPYPYSTWHPGTSLRIFLFNPNACADDVTECRCNQATQHSLKFFIASCQRSLL